MHFHQNMIEGLTAALYQIFIEEGHAEKVMANLLRSNPKWGSRDRRLLGEAGFELIRWKRLYMTVCDLKELESSDQIRQLILTWATHRQISIPTALNDLVEDEITINKKIDAAKKSRVIRESIPDWLDDVGVKDLGTKRWESELQALNKPSSVILRVNTLQTDVKSLKADLANENVESDLIPGYPHALELKGRRKVTQSKAYKKGWFEIQDAISQLVAPALDPNPGEIILDCCAGAGGKSLHLASLMENKGVIHAWDVEADKLNELQIRAKRNGISIIKTEIITPGKEIESSYEMADKVLIDAPCSGLGTLKRKPGLKWALTADKLDLYIKLQAKILQQYAPTVKRGGILVYATCSILTGENEDQISIFLKTETGKLFQLIEEKTYWPSETGYDGFYIARLQRK